MSSSKMRKSKHQKGKKDESKKKYDKEEESNATPCKYTRKHRRTRTAALDPNNENNDVLSFIIENDDDENIQKLNDCLVWLIQNKYSSLCCISTYNRVDGDEDEETIAIIVEAVVESFLETIGSANHEGSSSYSSSRNEDDNNDCYGTTGTRNGFLSYESAIEYLSQSLLDYDLLSDEQQQQQSRDIAKIALDFMCGKVDNYKKNTTHQGNSDESDNESSDDNNDNDDHVHDNNYIFSDDSDNDRNYIQDGECELCERSGIKLTRHHLIPKSTWTRIKSRFLHASPYFEQGNIPMVEEILSIGSPLPQSLTAYHCSSGSRVKQFLSCYTCDICSMCHKTVHNTFDNLILAEERNSVEKLLEDRTILKFCKWASKQRSRSKRICKK